MRNNSPDFGELYVECCPAPRFEPFAAGPFRWANMLRPDRTFWVTVRGLSPMPVYRVSIADEGRGDRFALQFKHDIKAGRKMPTCSLWRRLLPKVDRSIIENSTTPLDR
jgi:hypothetical protein